MTFFQYMKDDFCQEVKRCLTNHQYERFESIVRDNLSTVNNYGFIREILSCHPHVLRTKGIEILLNCGVDTSNFNIQYFIEANSKLFGYGTGEGNSANSFHYSLTLSIIRIMLQNPGKQEEYGNSSNKNENPLHSIMHSIFASLNSMNGHFRWDDSPTERENAKRSHLLLFTLVVLTSPSLLRKKNFDIHFKEERASLTPLELLAFYKTSYTINHPDLQELYDNFQEIIELTQSDKHSLSSTMKRLISHINCTQDRKRKLLDYSKLEEIVDKIKQEVESQGNTLAEKYFVDLSNLIIDHLPTILLDTYRSVYYRDLLKRKILERFYEVNIGNVNTTFGANLYVFQEIIEKFNTKTLDNFIKAILGDVCTEKLNLNDNNTLLQSYIVGRINGNAVIENSESIALDFLGFKEFLESNIAPHETKHEEKHKNKKLSEEALSDVYYLYEEDEKGYKDSGTQPILEEVSLVARKDSKLLSNVQGDSEQSSYLGKNNSCSTKCKSKLPVIAASMLAITGVALGIAIAVHLEMLAVGIVVGACFLVAAVIIYYCNKPSKSLENSNAEAVVNQIAVQNIT